MKFNVGDIVLVRSFEKLAAKYGVDEDGDVCFGSPDGYIFTREMRKYCGKVFSIASVNDENAYRLEPCGGDADDDIKSFLFTDNMLFAIDHVTQNNFVVETIDGGVRIFVIVGDEKFPVVNVTAEDFVQVNVSFPSEGGAKFRFPVRDYKKVS